MSGITTKAELAVITAATNVENAFESIPARLLTLGKHIEAAIAYPFTPDAVKSALPLLMTVITDMHQEVAELRKAPCEGCGQAAPTTGTASTTETPAAPVGTTTAAPEVIAPAPVDLAAKWPTYEAQLAAFTAGQMSEAEAAAFAPVHAKVVAFAASLQS